MPSEPRSQARRAAREKSKALLARLAAVESPDVTYLGERFPIVMKKAEGMAVTDVDGNRYLDFTACFGVLALGHRPAVTLNALRKQSAQLVHGMGDVHPSLAKIRLLETLRALTPFPEGKAVLSLSGGEAVETALKTAILATGRHRFLSFEGGYHGLHMGPLGLTDRGHFRQGLEGWLGNANTRIPFPFNGAEAALACEDDAPDPSFFGQTHGLLHWDEVLTRLEDALRSRAYAALVMEPLQGRGGERTYPSGFIKMAADLARHFGTIVIFDEIYSGFGRTGPMFAFEHAGVEPDLLCLGKALGGGLPLSACVGGIMDVWGRSTGEARHTSTFLGHPLACAVGHATLTALGARLPAFREELKKIDAEIVAFVGRCRAAGLGRTLPFRVRGAGFMRGFWFYASEPGFASALAEDLLEEGFIVLPSGPRGDVLSLTPPLIATRAHHRRLFTVLERLLRARPARLTSAGASAGAPSERPANTHET